MARIPVGKVLLRNVIRHTGAHNKIQEESEMWKIREKEKQASKMRFRRQRRPSASLPGNRMRCDGYDEEDEGAKAHFAARKVFTSPQDERESRYWTKKLYEFEASDPNRWGHSGYKELYPEEFESESNPSDSEELAANGAGPAPAKPPKPASRKRKRSSKASKKKRKKRSRKKSLRSSGSSSDEESSAAAEEEDSDRRRRVKAKKKRRRKEARKPKELPLGSSESGSSPGRASDTSSRDESDSRSRLSKRRRGKHRRSAPKGGAAQEVDGRRRRHRNWKLARNDTSDDSGDDDLN